MSFFSALTPLPADPVFGLYAAFQADPRPEKINLAIGLVTDEKGQIPLFSSVQEAERDMGKQKNPKTYLPIEGYSPLLTSSLELTYGSELPHASYQAVQTLGGTGGLKIAAEFLKSQGLPEIYLPNPTWSNHSQIFKGSALQVGFYPYYEENCHQLDFIGMRNFLLTLPPKAIILLQACCHNPSGLDPSLAQWEEIEQIMKERQLFPLFDLAYQGFGENLDADASAVRLFAKRGHTMMVSSSFSKNFGLYGERVGVLSIVNAPSALLSHLRALIRSSYSNPPLHGAKIVATVLQSSSLKKFWVEELDLMRQRLVQMRQNLLKLLENTSAESLHLPLQMQRGLFFLTSFNANQLRFLREEKAIYLLENGRLSLAGLNEKNLDRVAQALYLVAHEK